MLIRLFVLLILLLSGSCEPTKEGMSASFYHWKAKAKFTEKIQATLEEAKTSKIYLHYFDVTSVEDQPSHWFIHNPTYVLKEVEDDYKDYRIVPVVFITNESLKKGTPKILATNIKRLIDEISSHHFNQLHGEIQLDCDWTESTKELYFELIKRLQKHFSVSCTIRLHQIKFQKRTGIPPVEEGSLMLYNVGALTDQESNSILESDIVKLYINDESSYPLELSLALPLFSQTVLRSNQQQIRLVNGVDRAALDNHPSYFKSIGTNLYEVQKDTLCYGHYLSDGYQIELEQLSEEEVISSYQIIQNSQLNISEIIFYHLDDEVLNNINFSKILNAL